MKRIGFALVLIGAALLIVAIAFMDSLQEDYVIVLYAAFLIATCLGIAVLLAGGLITLVKGQTALAPVRAAKYAVLVLVAILGGRILLSWLNADPLNEAIESWWVTALVVTGLALYLTAEEKTA